MSKDNCTKHIAAGAAGSSRAARPAVARVLDDLSAAAEKIENGAFDLAGQAHADTVSELIAVAGELRSLIEELKPRTGR